uniref:Putative reverse transcriptase domain-containing protein n=1 Tax=Tanacetum cinerariifolium TaxID=118510 RepID=A0A699H8A9_TANCI|nr:putative reverse transcriptase domain-containing protein [Tanacetum cinerariifolium]
MVAMEKLVENLGNVEEKAECKKLKKELEEARGQDAAHVVRECTFAGVMKCNPTVFHGNEGAVKFQRWFEKTKSVFRISKCVQRARRFNELALMCPRMVEPERVKVDAYIQGLTDNIKGEVTSSKPTNLNKSVRMAQKLMEQKSKARDERILEGKKQKCLLDHFLCVNIVLLAILVYVQSSATSVERLGTREGHTRNQCPRKIKQVKAGEVGGRAYANKDVEPQGSNVITVPGAAPVARAPYRLAHSEMRELLIQLSKPLRIGLPNDAIEDEEISRIGCLLSEDASLKGYEVVLMQREKVIAYASRQLQVHEENYTTRDLEFGAVFALRNKPLHVRALMMTVHSDLPKQIHKAQKEAMKRKNVKSKHQKPSGLLQQPKILVWKWERITMDFILEIALESVGTNLDMSTTYHPQTDSQSERTIQTLKEMLDACVIDFGSSWDRHPPLVKFSYNNGHHASIKAGAYEALYERKCRWSVCWSEFGDSQLIGLKLIRDTTDKIVQIKNRLFTARSRQKSYENRRTKTLEFEVGDWYCSWPFRILARVGLVAYMLELPKELKGIHSTFHVLNLKKCLAKGDIVVLMEEIQLDDKLHMIEDPLEVVDRDVERLKKNRIPIVEVHCNSQRGLEFT